MRIPNLMSVCLSLALCTITLHAESNPLPGTFASMPQSAESYLDISVPGAHSSSIIYSNLPFTVYFGIDKKGNLPLEKLNIGFFLSEDLTRDAGDLFIGEYTTAGLDTLNTYWFHQVLDSMDLSSVDEGSYYLIVAADYDNFLEESIESNNTFITQVVLCKSYEMPENLEISHLSTTGDTVSSGSKIGIDVSLRSEYLDEQLNVDLYISKDTLLDENDPMFYSQYISINENQQRNFSTDYEPLLNAEEGWPEGLYYIFAIVDMENRVRERVESDNQRYTPLYIKETATYDIEAESLVLGCDSVLGNHSIRMKSVLKNNGSAYIPQGEFHYYLSPDTSYSSDDIYLSKDYFPNLRPGESAEISSITPPDTNLPPGEYYVLGRADTLDAYKEYNEINNVNHAPVGILDPSKIDDYDLEILGIIADDTINPYQNVYFTVSYFFHNNERAKINMGAYISNDTVLGIEDLSTRIIADDFYSNAMTELNRTFRVTLPADQDTGKFFLIFKGDDFNHMAEDNEDNNIAIKPVWFYPEVNNTVNLELSYLFPEPQMAGLGSMISGRYGIRKTTNLTPDLVFTDFLMTEIGSGEEIFIGTDTTMSPDHDITEYKFSFPVPDAVSPGTYTLRALVRIGDSYEEPYHEDNEKSAHIALVESDPDYVIVQLHLNSSFTYPGYQAGFSIDLKNKGTTGPSKPFVSYFLSEDAALSENDTHLLTKQTPELGIQMMRTLDESVTIPTGMSAGQYYLIAVLDAENYINETDETNNIHTVPVEILPNGPNLVIEYAQIDTSELVSDQKYHLSFRIRNNGNRSASTSRTGFYLSTDTQLDGSDVYIGGSTSYNLYVGQQHTVSTIVTIPKGTAAGNYQLLLVADNYGNVNEVNEDDNVLAIPVSVSDPVIDLEIEGTSVTDTLKILQGTSLDLLINVANHGEHSTSGEIYIYAYISSDSIFDPFSDMYVNSHRIRQNILPGIILEESARLYLPEWISYNKCWVFLLLDATNNVTEINELNNTYSIPTMFTESDADLYFSMFNFNPDTTSYQGKIDYSYTIRNQGSTMTNTSFRTELYLSTDSVFDNTDLRVRYDFYNALDAQATASESGYFNLPWTYGSGKYFLIGLIDKDERIIETNQENNSVIQPFWIVPKDIDLIISDLILDYESGISGQLMRGSYEVNNTGEESQDYGFRAKVYFSADTVYDASDMLIANDYFYMLGSNSYMHKSFSYYVPDVDPGQYYILAVADTENSSIESNENNNTSYTRFDVTADYDGPDYTLEVRAIHQDLGAGSIEVTCGVMNIGNYKGGALTFCKFYLSHDEEPDPGDFLLKTKGIQPLDAGAEQEISINEILPEEKYDYLIITVDDTGFVFDQDRSNNNYTYLLEQELPYDLIMESSLVSEQIYQGDTVRFTSLIERQGARLLDSVSIAYYISRDSILDSTAEPLIMKMITISTEKFTEDSFEYVMPETVETGTYYGIVALAWDTIGIESNTGNNFEYLKFEVMVKPSDYIDLVVSTPDVIEDARGGDTIQIKYQLENRGIIDADSLSLDYYLSTDLIISAEDTLLHSNIFSSLEVGGMQEITQELILPLETEKGDYLVLIHAYGDDQVIEYDESNNLGAISYRLGSPLGNRPWHQPLLIDLYPNPASDFLILESSKIIESFRISDMHGRILHEEMLRNDRGRIRVNQFKPGMYLIWVSTPDEAQVLKFIVD